MSIITFTADGYTTKYESSFQREMFIMHPDAFFQAAVRAIRKTVYTRILCLWKRCNVTMQAKIPME